MHKSFEEMHSDIVWSRIRLLVGIPFKWCLSFRATELQNKVADRCVQLHGGWGYMWEYPICKAYVDARPQTIYGGSNEIMKELIVRSIVADWKK